MMHVSEIVMNRMHGMQWSQYVGFFYRTLCTLHDEKNTEEKLSLQCPCSNDFRRFAWEFFFVVNTPTVVLSFYYIECELFAVFIKMLFNNWKHFFHPSVIHVPVKCPWDGGIWSPEWTLVWGIWTAFWLGEGGIWTIIFKKVKCLGCWPEGGC